MSVHRRVEARNRGLDRISRLTSLTLTGGLVLSGGFATLAARAYAGHSKPPVPTGARNPVASRATRATRGNTGTTGTTAPVLPLQPPPSAPQSGASSPPQTVPQTSPQTVPQTTPPTVPPYVPPTVVSGGS
jgi:hypothetical protein